MARYAFTLATEQHRSHRDLSDLVAVGLLQDAVEAFLGAAAESLSLPVKDSIAFADLFDAVDRQIGNKLPIRKQVMALNRMRVSAKHHGIAPDRAELDRAVTNVGSFMEDAAPKVFGVALANMTLIDLLDADEARTHLDLAEAELSAGRFFEALTECRKAFYLTFEKRADVWRYRPGPQQNGLIDIFFGNTAPQYARSPEYVDQYVREPSERIVLDRARVETELLAEGIDVVVFWNIRRITPAVVQDDERGWLVQEHPTIFAMSDIEQKARYVFDNTIEIMLRRQARRRSHRWAGEHRRLAYVTGRPRVTVYAKADDRSQPLFTIEDEGTTLDVQHITPGPQGNGRYVYVATRGKGGGLVGLSNGVYGYVPLADIGRPVADEPPPGPGALSSAPSET